MRRISSSVTIGLLAKPQTPLWITRTPNPAARGRAVRIIGRPGVAAASAESSAAESPASAAASTAAASAKPAASVSRGGVRTGRRR